MIGRKPRSTPEQRQPAGPPEPIGLVALAVGLASCALWLDGPVTAIEVLLGVLAVFTGIRRR